MTDENNRRTQYDDEVDEAIRVLADDDTDVFWLEVMHKGEPGSVIGFDRWLENRCNAETINDHEMVPEIMVASMIRRQAQSRDESSYDVIQRVSYILGEMENVGDTGNAGDTNDMEGVDEAEPPT